MKKELDTILRPIPTNVKVDVLDIIALLHAGIHYTLLTSQEIDLLSEYIGENWKDTLECKELEVANDN